MLFYASTFAFLVSSQLSKSYHYRPLPEDMGDVIYCRVDEANDTEGFMVASPHHPLSYYILHSCRGGGVREVVISNNFKLRTSL